MRDFSKELIVKTSVSTTVKGKNIFIPEDATNGDVIKAVFPKAKIFNEDTSCATMKIDMGEHDEYVDFYTDWWNAKYKGGVSE